MPGNTNHVDLDVPRIVECFGRYGVDYLIVGGVAANFHGALRPTGDLDSLALKTADNLDRLARPCVSSERSCRSRV